MSPVIPVPPDTDSWEEAVTHGFFGERTDPYPDTLYVPGIQADPDLTPTVTDVDPATGPEAGNIYVTLTGTLLFSPVVTIGGAGVTLAGSGQDGTWVGGYTPPGTGVADIVVTTPGGTVTLTGGYTYEAPPPP